MARIMREEEASEALATLLAEVDAEGPILVEREGDGPPILVLALGQPGRAAIVSELEKIVDALKGQPGRAAAQGQPGRALAQGQPGRAAVEEESGPEVVAGQLEELVEAMKGQPGRA